MSKVIDARGLSCPQRVVLTKKILEEADEVTVIVDNSISRHNERHMEENHGCEVNIEEMGDGIYLHLTKEATADIAPTATPAVGPTVLVMASDQMGRGEKELGSILIRALLHTLCEVSPLPDKMIFSNIGMNLTIEGSEVPEDLRTLKEKGVEILSVAPVGGISISRKKWPWERSPTCTPSRRLCFRLAV
jgi:selenium metabolism protein YedF